MPGENVMPDSWPSKILEQVFGRPVDQIVSEQREEYSGLAEIIATAFWSSGMGEINPEISVIFFRKINSSLADVALSPTQLSEKQSNLISEQLSLHLPELKGFSGANLYPKLADASRILGSTLKSQLRD